MRWVRASRLRTRDCGWSEIDVLVAAVLGRDVEGDPVEAVFVDLEADREEYFEVRCFVVLKGLAIGARLMVFVEVSIA